MKKKVCFLSHGLSNNGIDIFVRNVATRLDGNKWDISVILALDDEGKLQPREQEVLDAGVQVFRTCDLGSIKRMLLHAKRLYRLLKERKPDVFHSNMDLLNGLNCLVAWAAGVPVRISHSHTSASQYEKKTGRHFISRLYRGCMKLLGRVFSNRKCGCSDVAMDYLFGTGWKGQRNTAVINTGVDLSRFRRSAEKASDRKHIVSVGRLCDAKNPLFALEVMDALRRLRTDFIYEWIGDGELRKQMEEAIAEKGLQDHVKLLGVRNDIEKLLPARDLFFMPSLFEGLPISLIEAQAAGLACLVSGTITREVDCGACRFQPLEAPAADWAKVLSDILDGKHTLAADPEKLRKFDISYTIEQLEQVYNG